MDANTSAGRLVLAAHRINTRKFSFLAVFLVVLFVAVSICMAIGFVPDASSSSLAVSATSTDPFLDVSSSQLIAGAADATPIGTVAQTQTVNAPAATNGSLNMNGELPTKVVIPSIGVSANIANPATTDVDALDTYLLKGAARYPTSATLSQQGNIILFGHSSYLPIVINQHYKTFDGIQNLKSGDQITVYGTTNVYTYAVTNVQKESEADDDSIPLTTTGHTLTLATCNSFGTKSDRFVVTATLVGSYPLGSQSSQ